LGRRRTIFLGIGCGLFAYLLIRLGPGKILSLLLRIGWAFPLFLVIYAGYTLVRASALARCVPAGEGYSYRDLVAIRLAGEAVQYLTFTGPILAEPAKALLLRNRGLPTTHAFAATIAEYLIYTFTSAIMAVLGLIYLLHTFDVPRSVSVAARIVILIAGMFLGAAAVAIVGRIYLIGAIVNSVRKLPRIGSYLRVDEKGLRDTENLLFEVLRAQPLRFLSIVATEFVAQALLVLELFVLLRATGEPFPLSRPFLIESATKFISMGFFFIPGQVGAAEAVYALIFKALGLPASAGVSLALARRLRSLLIAGAGLIFLARCSGRASAE
jgi:uncharacterized membrane protein YbhN (UPF0104 family)